MPKNEDRRINENKIISIMNKTNLRPATRTIIARIEERKFLKDKYAKDYMFLSINNDNPIFVFPTKIEQLKWNSLKEGSEYKFTVEEGKGSNNILVGFEKRE